MVKQELGLQAVGEWYPGEVSKGQHEAKAIMYYVHGGEDRLLQGQPRYWLSPDDILRISSCLPCPIQPHLIPEGITHIQQLEAIDQTHGQ